MNKINSSKELMSVIKSGKKSDWYSLRQRIGLLEFNNISSNDFFIYSNHELIDSFIADCIILYYEATHVSTQKSEYRKYKNIIFKNLFTAEFKSFFVDITLCYLEYMLINEKEYKVISGWFNGLLIKESFNLVNYENKIPNLTANEMYSIFLLPNYSIKIKNYLEERDKGVLIREINILYKRNSSPFIPNVQNMPQIDTLKYLSSEEVQSYTSITSESEKLVDGIILDTSNTYKGILEKNYMTIYEYIVSSEEEIALKYFISFYSKMRQKEYNIYLYYKSNNTEIDYFLISAFALLRKLNFPVGGEGKKNNVSLIFSIFSKSPNKEWIGFLLEQASYTFNIVELLSTFRIICALRLNENELLDPIQANKINSLVFQNLVKGNVVNRRLVKQGSEGWLWNRIDAGIGDTFNSFPKLKLRYIDEKFSYYYEQVLLPDFMFLANRDAIPHDEFSDLSKDVYNKTIAMLAENVNRFFTILEYMGYFKAFKIFGLRGLIVEYVSNKTQDKLVEAVVPKNLIASHSFFANLGLGFLFGIAANKITGSLVKEPDSMTTLPHDVGNTTPHDITQTKPSINRVLDTLTSQMVTSRAVDNPLIDVNRISTPDGLGNIDSRTGTSLEDNLMLKNARETNSPLTGDTGTLPNLKSPYAAEASPNKLRISKLRDVEYERSLIEIFKGKDVGFIKMDKDEVLKYGGSEGLEYDLEIKLKGEEIWVEAKSGHYFQDLMKDTERLEKFQDNVLKKLMHTKSKGKGFVIISEYEIPDVMKQWFKANKITYFENIAPAIAARTDYKILSKEMLKGIRISPAEIKLTPAEVKKFGGIEKFEFSFKTSIINGKETFVDAKPGDFWRKLDPKKNYWEWEDFRTDLLKKAEYTSSKGIDFAIVTEYEIPDFVKQWLDSHKIGFYENIRLGQVNPFK